MSAPVEVEVATGGPHSLQLSQPGHRRHTQHPHFPHSPSPSLTHRPSLRWAATTGAKHRSAAAWPQGTNQLARGVLSTRPSYWLVVRSRSRLTTCAGTHHHGTGAARAAHTRGRHNRHRSVEPAGLQDAHVRLLDRF